MKILAVERMAGEWPSEAASALFSAEVANPGCLAVTLMTDSAAVRRGMPMFIADFATEWELEVLPFLSIGRLGKSIPPRFAGRYIDGCGLAVRAVPPLTSSSGCVPGALAVNFDGALAPGEKLPVEQLCQDVVEIEAEGFGSVRLCRDDMRVDETVSLISRYMMLKTGDIILPCRTGLRVPVGLDTRLDCRLNGLQAISLKIK